MRQDVTPRGYVEHARIWSELGASIIGGCCGIGPDHIQLLKEWRDQVETLAEAD